MNRFIISLLTIIILSGCGQSEAAVLGIPASGAIVSQASPEACRTAAGIKRCRITSGYTITSPMTWGASDPVLELEKGALLTFSGSGSLTMNGTLVAGMYQVFAGTRDVKWGPLQEVVYTEWFGAVGDNVTDDSAAINYAIASCIANNIVNTPKLKFLSKSYYIASDLVVVARSSNGQQNSSKFRIEGTGGGQQGTAHTADNAYRFQDCTLIRRDTAGVFFRLNELSYTPVAGDSLSSHNNGAHPAAGTADDPFIWLHTFDISNLSLYNSIGNGTLIDGIVGRGISESSFRNITMYALRDGFRFGRRFAVATEVINGTEADYCERNHIFGCSILFTNHHVNIQSPDRTVIEQCYLSRVVDTNGTLIFFTGGSDPVIRNNILHCFINNSETVVKAVVWSVGTYVLTIQNNHIENLWAPIVLTSFENHDAVIVRDNHIDNNVYTGATYFNILLRKYGTFTFKDNSVQLVSPASYFFRVDAGDGEESSRATVKLDVFENQYVTGLRSETIKRLTAADFAFGQCKAGLKGAWGNPIRTMYGSTWQDNFSRQRSKSGDIEPLYDTDGIGVDNTGRTATPTTGTWALGDRIVRAPVVGQPKGWTTTVAGTAGTLNSGATTGNTTATSTEIVLSSITGIYTGAYITVAGIGGTTTKRILSMVESTKTITVDTAATNTVTGGAVSYVAPTFVSEGNL